MVYLRYSYSRLRFFCSVGIAGGYSGNGSVSGIDYLRIRADGRIDLDIKATIATDDGHCGSRLHYPN